MGQRPVPTAFSHGVTWNLASFCTVALAGLLINLLIGRFYQPEILGIFNFVLAVFIFGGQLGAFAVQYSVLYHTPRVIARNQPAGEVLSSALLLSAMASAPIALIVWLGSAWFAETIGNPSLTSGLRVASYGLFVFPLNKILLAYTNGRQEMLLYAAGNAGRSLLVLLAVAAFVVFHWDGDNIAVSLTAAEWVVFLCLLFVNRTHLVSLDRRRWRRWCRRHLSYGSRGVLGGILFELNTRVDVFALALLADMRAVGVYSMASIFAEGLFQLLIVLRYNYDPTISRLLVERRLEELKQLIRAGRRLGYLAMFVIGSIAMVCYPWVIDIMVDRNDYEGSSTVFRILAIGIMLAAGYIPFSGYLLQAGRPGAQSTLIGAVMLTNVIGNVLLIPTYGVIGAAVGTAISQVAYIFYLKLLAARRTHVRI